MYDAAQTSTMGRCSNETNEGERFPTQLSETVSRAPIQSIKGRQAMGKKDEYFATMESEIKKWDAQVDDLNAKGAQMSADLRVGYDAQLKAMRANRDIAYSKLQEMRTANESAWQQMQSGMDAAWTSMKNALDKASSQLK
jgi:hypothetical protein